MSPRVLEDSLHPRLQSGASVRPLNFTVRSHLGGIQRREELEASPRCFATTRTPSDQVVPQASSLGASDVRLRPRAFDQSRGARPSSVDALIGRACGDARQARARVIEAPGAR